MFTVVCSTGDIRLRDGATNYEGRVEICYNNAWGTVCQDGWTFHESIVACRQLGLSGIGKFDVRPGKIVFIHTRHSVLLYFRHTSLAFMLYIGTPLLEANTIGTKNFVRFSKVSLAQGLVIDHAPSTIAASYYCG